MKLIIIFLALFLILAQPASAVFRSTDIIPDLISKGFDWIIESQADYLYDMIGVNSSDIQPAVSTLMAQKNDFLSNPSIQRRRTSQRYGISCFI